MSEVISAGDGKTITRPHTVQTENCKKSFLTGVTEVLGTSDTQLLLATTCGNLDIAGTELRIVKFNSESGELVVTGNLTAWRYNAQKAKGSFLKRLFK